MAQLQDINSIRSNNVEHPFPFQHDDGHPHSTLLPNGILNDEEDEVVPWPRRSSRSESAEQIPVLRVHRLPQDMTSREFAALFTFADGFQGSDLLADGDERFGIARFSTYAAAERAMLKMSSVSTGPYSKLSFEIVTKRASQDLMVTASGLSTSIKSNGSNGSMPHISRLSSYVKEKNGDSQGAFSEYYGSSSMSKSNGMSGSINSNYSNGTTVWSPTSPRFPSEMSKSPPSNLSMLPPSIDEEAWSRSGQNGHMNNNRFAQLSINTAMASQDARMTPLQSPSLSSHPHSAPLYPNMDGTTGHGHSLSRSSYSNLNTSSSMFPSSPPKHYVTGPATNGANNNYNSQGSYNNRIGSAPVNTNPADQNPPCNTLYVGNLPLATTEEELKSLFSRQPGYRRLCYRTKSNGPMCFVEFEDVHYAINSLKLLQGVILSSSIKGGIRLSFSKNPLGVRKMDSNQMLPHQPNIITAQNNNSYNSMHAPPGLQPGQMHGSSQAQHSINPIWR